MSAGMENKVDNPKNARLVLVSDDEDDENVQEAPIATEDLLAQYPDDSEDVDLSRARLTSCGDLNLTRFAIHLKRLCLRANFISTIEPEVFGTLNALEELDLYDNKVKQLGKALDGKQSLRILDLSFNLLRAVPVELLDIPSLEVLYFVQNKITRIENLDHIGASLRSLELGSNRIREIENLDALVNLEELWLGKNKITKLENLDKVVKLRLLSIQSNRITKIEGLDALVNLEELYMSHNGLTKLEGLDKNTKMKTLDIGNNEIAAIENISHLVNLQEFWASYNKIPDLKALESELGGTKTLETVYLEGNPAQLNDPANYRRKIMLLLPQVQQIDATMARE